MPIPENARHYLFMRLRSHAREQWPALTDVALRYRGSFAYIAGITTGGEKLPLCRLGYVGSHDLWSFAIYLASKDGYEESFLPSGGLTGSPEEALDCACGLYLNYPTAWLPDDEVPKAVPGASD